MKSCGVCALGCSALRGSDRFTVTKSVQKGRGISLPRRDLPVISALVAIRQTQVAKFIFALACGTALQTGISEEVRILIRIDFNPIKYIIAFKILQPPD
jgi:hypothetical protein